MRVLPIIEIVLIGAFGLLVVALLVFAFCWHLHVVAVDRLAAAQKPRPGISLPPPMDPGLDAAVHAWSDPIRDRYYSGNRFDGSYAFASSRPDIMAWLLDRTAARPQQVAILLDRPDPAFDALPGLLARGMRRATTGLTEAACRDELRAADATAPAGVAAVIDELDVIAAASATPAGVAEQDNAFFIASRRDQAYLATALRGTLPEANRLRWQQEPDDGRSHMLLALEGERMEHALVEFRPRVMESPIAIWRQDIYPPPSLSTFPQAFSAWWDQPEVFARNLAELAAAEDLVANATWLDHSENRIWLNYIAERSGRHRMTVLAVALVTWHRATGDFPASVSLLGGAAFDLGPGPERAALVYTRVDADHCRIRLDPGSSNAFAQNLSAGGALYHSAQPCAGILVDTVEVELDLGPRPVGQDGTPSP